LVTIINTAVKMALLFRKAIISCFILSSLGAVSCNNIFHDLRKQALIKPLSMPAIEYTYPLNGDTGIDTNKFLVVSFTKDMNESSLTKDSFIISKSDDPLQIVSISQVILLSKRVVIIYPAAVFENDTEYTVSLEEGINDLEGLMLMAGYSWRFTTGSDADIVRPEITPYPLDGSLSSPNAVDIWARFSEKMVPSNSVLRECFTVTKSDGSPVPGTATFDVVLAGDGSGNFEYIARFKPAPAFVFENDAEYTASIVRSSSGVYLTDLANNELIGKTWHFSTSVGRAYLENAQNINNGRASFGNRGGGIGEQLRTPEGVLIADMFDAGDSLESIFDLNTSGEMAAGRYIRIVDRWRNIVADLGLTPVMKYLTGDYYSPPGDQCYIDPLYGIFVLPRPNYWSKMGALVNNDLVPELREAAEPILRLTSSTLAVVAGKTGFGNCIEMNGNGASMWDLYPFGETEAVNRGTVSVWWNPNGALDYYFKIFIGGPDSYIDIKNNYARIVINGAEQINKTEDLALARHWNHIYAVWDIGNPGPVLDGGTKRVRVFINGVERAWCLTAWTPGVFSCRAESHMGVFGSNNYVDNLKVWKHVVSENCEWEYKGGVGRERALHVIYGRDDSNEEYDYRPKLTGSGSGVGYYYLP
jgi:hypothetical protein